MTKKWICTTIFAFALAAFANAVLAQQQQQQPQPQAINPWGAQPYQSGTGQPYQAHSFNGQSATVSVTPAMPTPVAGSTSGTSAANTQTGMATQPMSTGSGNVTSAGMIPSGTAVPHAQQPAYKPMPVFNPYQQTNRKISGGGAAVYGQFTPSGPVDRPFEHYQAPSHISPYMQLYRTDNILGIDNYNMYVKPAIEAEQQRIEMQNQLDTLQQQQQAQMQQNPQLFQQNPQSTQSVSGAVYGNINSGLGASYNTTAPNVPTTEQATSQEDEEDETQKTDQQTDQNTTPNYNVLNPYIPAGAKPSQYMVKP